MEIVVGGIYKHYKGDLYEVFGVASNSETGEDLVVYRAKHGNEKLWVRPVGMFLEDVDVDGESCGRFVLVG